MDAMPPNLNPGQQLKYTKRPFLGFSRVNYLIALFNAVMKTKVNVVSVVGNTNTPELATSIAPSWKITSQSSILTIPIPIASNGTNAQGWNWTAGSRNYNPDSTYHDQQVVYVQASSGAVTSGLLDADTLANQKSIAGMWVALQTVSPAVISGVTHYHVPRLPMPAPDDMNDSANYWAFVSQAPQCI